MIGNRSILMAGAFLSTCALYAGDVHPQLDRLRDDYRTQIVALARDRSASPLDRSRAIVALARTYTRDLTDIQKSFLMQNRIKEAVAVKNEVDRAMSDKLLLAAVAVVKKADEEQQARPPPPRPDIERDLVLHYSFENDPEGFAADSSPARNHGQLVGPITHEQTVRGKVVRLTGPNTYIASAAKTLNTDGWPAITLSAWVLLKRYTAYGVVMARGEISGSKSGGFFMQVGGRNGPLRRPGRFSVAGSELEPTSLAVDADPPLKLNEWYHLVGTYDGREISFYVNGALDSRAPATGKGAPLADDPATRLVIGNSATQPYIAWPDMYFDGWLDDVRIWKRALTSSQVEQLHKQEATKR